MARTRAPASPTWARGRTGDGVRTHGVDRRNRGQAGARCRRLKRQ
ncbi:hypothetical protein I552_2186 [Mycobacterium xenopi 3993]|nr:hypothetical protein I552_2186 [Mycobacterium xenopi 3993]